ncbi:MAG: linear amide C-N hydrolase [Anaerolineales bacterium]
MKTNSSPWQTSIPRRYFLFVVFSNLLLTTLLGGCSAPGNIEPTLSPQLTVQTSPIPTIHLAKPTVTHQAGLSANQVATLSSLKLVDDYPLYTMHYSGSYNQTNISPASFGRYVLSGSPIWKGNDVWGCSLFASFGDTQNILFGRNFDWEYSPAVLLFTDPPDGFASVSMVDIAYLGFDEGQVKSLTELTLEERQALLTAPDWPFDGMNEKGLAIGMAAVPPGQMPYDSDKNTIGSLGVMREILDTAGNIDQAVAVLENYNLDFQGGPALHYLIADSTGRAILVEFYQGQMKLIPNDSPWHQATNYLRSAVEETQGQCNRYDKITHEMENVDGKLSATDGLDLLSGVAQPGTQWSILYHMSSGEIDVVIGRQFDNPYRFDLNP